MVKRGPSPGVSRDERLSEDGLERLRKQLQGGTKPAAIVLQQWVKRYGEAAREIIRDAGHDVPDVDA